MTLSPVAIAVTTPAYISYVVFVFAMKVKDPFYVSNHLDRLIKALSLSSLPLLCETGKSRFAQPADLLKLLEALLEANIQAMIGELTDFTYKLLNYLHTFAFASPLHAAEQGVI